MLYHRLNWHINLLLNAAQYRLDTFVLSVGIVLVTPGGSQHVEPGLYYCWSSAPWTLAVCYAMIHVPAKVHRQPSIFCLFCCSWICSGKHFGFTYEQILIMSVCQMHYQTFSLSWYTSFLFWGGVCGGGVVGIPGSSHGYCLCSGGKNLFFYWILYVAMLRYY